jgi:integrase
MTQKITQRTVKGLRAERENRIVWDSELKGFGVRITPAGAITFILNYRSHGRQRRYKIGRAPEWTAEAARAEAAKIKPKIDSEGYDPLESKQKARGEPTMVDLATEYLKHRQDKSASTRRNDRQMLDGIVLPRLGKLRLAAVNSRDIEGLKEFLEATPYRANRVLALVSHMFSKAMEWKWAKENPARGIARYHEDRRERWLSTEELGALRKALDSYSDQNAANALRLLLLTGAREGEVLKAAWEQFDLQRGTWTKPSHHTKQKKIEHVPLNDEALALLRKMNAAKKSGPLFPGRDGKAARVSLRKPWVQVCKAAGLAEAITKQGKRRKKVTKYKPLVRIHDLRHTFASHLVSNGASLQVVGKLIGHTQMATTMRYAHLSDGALRDATNNFGKIFTGLQVVDPRKDAPARKRAAGE